MAQELMVVTMRSVGHRATKSPTGQLMTTEACNLDQVKGYKALITLSEHEPLKHIQGLQNDGRVRLCKRCFKNELISMELYD